MPSLHRWELLEENAGCTEKYVMCVPDSAAILDWAKNSAGFQNIVAIAMPTEWRKKTGLQGKQSEGAIN
jgi:hypothetical protein